MDNTRRLIEQLYAHHEDYAQGRTQDLYQVCYDCKQAAEELEAAIQFINDLNGDHYTDYLEFYTNRCIQLEEKIEEIKNILEE